MRSVLYTFMLILALTGCTTNRFYAPNTAQVPMISQQHQATISGGGSITSTLSGWEAQGIYSPLPHVGLMASHFQVHYKGQVLAEYSPFFYETPYTGDSRFTEAGLGGYFEAGANKEYLVSLYGGFGQGKVFNRYAPPPDIQTTGTYDSSWKYRRWFVQPSLSMKAGRFQAGAALRLAWLNFYDGNINSRMGILETERIQKLEASSPLFLTELAWSVGYRLKPVVFSLNSTGIVIGKNSVRDLELASHYVSLSAGLNIHELFKAKKNAQTEKGKKKKKSKKSKKRKKRK